VPSFFFFFFFFFSPQSPFARKIFSFFFFFFFFVILTRSRIEPANFYFFSSFLNNIYMKLRCRERRDLWAVRLCLSAERQRLSVRQLRRAQPRQERVAQGRRRVLPLHPDPVLLLSRRIHTYAAESGLAAIRFVFVFFIFGGPRRSLGGKRKSATTIHKFFWFEFFFFFSNQGIMAFPFWESGEIFLCGMGNSPTRASLFAFGDFFFCFLSFIFWFRSLGPPSSDDKREKKKK
jgi:hypothetical protein